jgi:hypothetical protein
VSGAEPREKTVTGQAQALLGAWIPSASGRVFAHDVSGPFAVETGRRAGS